MTRRFLLSFALALGSLSNLAAEDLRILAFGDSNTWGWIPNGGGMRYEDNERWAGVLQTQLGLGTTVVCDGLVARRTTLDGLTAGPVDGSFLNSAKTLPAAIARNAPLDLVLIFLGTNDVQAGAERSATEVAAAIGDLVELTRAAEKLLYSSYPAPDIWVVVPAPLQDLSGSTLETIFEVGYETSQDFPEAFRALEASHHVTLIQTSKILENGIGEDGIHLNKHGHAELGTALSSSIKEHLLPE